MECEYLLLNEEIVNQLTEPNRTIYIFEWLSSLEKALVSSSKLEVKNFQKKLVEQLMNQIKRSPGPHIRKLLANCLTLLFSVGDTFLLFDTTHTCNNIVKNKNDSPNYLPIKLAAICVLGSMYEKLGRMMGRSYEETVQILLRALRNAESQLRIEIIITLEKICHGMGNAIESVGRDIYKAIKHMLIDRVMSVRIATAKCILGVHRNAPLLYRTEVETLSSLCFRSLEGSNYGVRCSIANLLGILLGHTQKQQEECQRQVLSSTSSKIVSVRIVSLEQTLGILMSGFLRGGASFLKGTGEIIKGSSNVSREVRVGITYAYVAFVEYMGSVWIERNLSPFLSHVLDLVSNPKASSSHVDAVYSRKCITFILHSVLGKLLREKAQVTACKELISIIGKQMNMIDFNPENAKDSNQETLFSQHLLVCALQEFASLVQCLGTTAQNLLADTTLNAIDITCTVLIHPCVAARLSAAWCLKCFCIAVPSLISPFIDRFVEALEQIRSSPEAIWGYSCALASVVGSVKYSTLGIPYKKGKIIFNIAEELLRSASQNGRMSLSRIQAGWLLIGSIMTLESTVVKDLLPRVLLLWRHSFPRSNKELESEKARGDSFTWQVTLEGRAGALSVMFSFLSNCPDLVSNDIIRRLIVHIESAIAMLINLSPILKNYGSQLKTPAALLRLRLFETLTQLPANVLDGSYMHLLRLLIAEFTLAESSTNISNSLLKSLCSTTGCIIFGVSFQEINHYAIENQLQFNSAAGSGALEHDPSCLYRKCKLNKYSIYDPYRSQFNECPGPLPLGVAVIDMSIILFGVIFPKVTNKHRLQIFDHFLDCIKQAKSTRQETIQINIFSALLNALKCMSDSKSSIGQDDIRKSACTLILSALCSSNALVRCASAEALGRLAQVVGESKFTAELSQRLFEKLKSSRDIITRTGHSLGLGCLHRYVGSMSCSQHLNTNVSILHALAKDVSSPMVQLWAMHALALIADSGGPVLHGYVEVTLALCLKLLLNLPQSNTDLIQCIGRVLNALITTMGPELQGNTNIVSNIRKSVLYASSIMEKHSDPLVQAEAITCLQQLHLFTPESINLSTLVPNLIINLSSKYIAQRKAAIACLRQIVHREAKLVCDLALLITTEDYPKHMIIESGLPGILFAMLDLEFDNELVQNIQDTLTSMISLVASENLSTWLTICSKVLTIAIENPQEKEVSMVNNNKGFPNASTKIQTKFDKEEEDDIDDLSEYHANENVSMHPIMQPRWTTRVFAAQCIRRMIASCELSNECLTLHLSELVRMSFIAATSDSDQLRLEGLCMLYEIIEHFARVPEPEFPGHYLLEQYQAQIGAALRPAFTADTPSHVLAAACEVCSSWIGCGVTRDLNDLRRVHQLLVTSLNKFNTKTTNSAVFNESMITLEKLSILKAWADVYINAMECNGSAPIHQIRNLRKNKTIDSIENLIEIKSKANREIEINSISSNSNPKNGLLLLVQPELHNLSTHWLSALRDHALLLLPFEFRGQLPHDGGAFYSADAISSSKLHYIAVWSSILYASCLWLNDAVLSDIKSLENSNYLMISESTDRFHIIFGICIEALCNIRSSENPKNVVYCLQSVYTLLYSEWARCQLMKDVVLIIELCSVMHRQILTCDNFCIQSICIDVLKLSILAAKEDLNRRQNEHLKCSKNNSQLADEIDDMGEGKSTGKITPGESFVYGALEACVCVLVHRIPNISPNTFNVTKSLISNSFNMLPTMQKKSAVDCSRLIANTLDCIESLPMLCSPKGALSILPTLLHLIISVIREIAIKTATDSTNLANSTIIQASLHLLEVVCKCKWSLHHSICSHWLENLQSALATLVDLARTSSDNERKIDEVTMLQVISVFILHAPPSVISTACLQYPCINHFRQYLQSDNLIVKLECIKTARSIFANTKLKISKPYIRTLGPRIIGGLYLEIGELTSKEIEVQIFTESVLTVEVLIKLAEPKQRIQICNLLVPVLISHLVESSKLQMVDTWKQQLHDNVLQSLLKIGPKYPQEFKFIISQSNDLRQKLENAIRCQPITTSDFTNAMIYNTGKQPLPAIKLKTDFSNFQ